MWLVGSNTNFKTRLETGGCQGRAIKTIPKQRWPPNRRQPQNWIWPLKWRHPKNEDNPKDEDHLKTKKPIKVKMTPKLIGEGGWIAQLSHIPAYRSDFIRLFGGKHKIFKIQCLEIKLKGKQNFSFGQMYWHTLWITFKKSTYPINTISFTDLYFELYDRLQRKINTASWEMPTFLSFISYANSNWPECSPLFSKYWKQRYLQ